MKTFGAGPWSAEPDCYLCSTGFDSRRSNSFQKRNARRLLDGRIDQAGLLLMSIQVSAQGRNSKRDYLNSPLTLADFAEAKRLPVDFLEREGLHNLSDGRGIGIRYCDFDGAELYVKRRTALKAKEGSFLPPGAKQYPYGLNRLDKARRDGTLFVTEGETDALTLIFHGYGVIGMPGAGSAKCLTAEAIECIDQLFILRDSDEAGRQFVFAMVERLKAARLPRSSGNGQNARRVQRSVGPSRK